MKVYIVTEIVLTKDGVVHDVCEVHSHEYAAEKSCESLNELYSGDKVFAVTEWEAE